MGELKYIAALSLTKSKLCGSHTVVQCNLDNPYLDYSYPSLSVPSIIRTPEPKKIQVEERKFSFNQVFNCEKSDLKFTLLRESTLASSLSK